MTADTSLQLRPTTIADLTYLFAFQTDPRAIYLAAFTPKDPSNKAAYIIKYTKILDDPTSNNHTILLDNLVVGSVAKFILDGHAEITYWIDRKFWGQGIATLALQQFLTIETTRPLVARVACDNLGSQKVLEKCGFTKTGTDKGFANARQTEIEEFIYRLS